MRNLAFAYILLGLPVLLKSMMLEFASISYLTLLMTF